MCEMLLQCSWNFFKGITDLRLRPAEEEVEIHIQCNMYKIEHSTDTVNPVIPTFQRTR